ncbi:MAG: hypothetical protein R3B70_14560 [Polyangiaceae bacterium]
MLIGAALLITGCMGSGETAGLDATELANDDLAEDVLLDGDNDRASMLETPDWDSMKTER